MEKFTKPELLNFLCDGDSDTIGTTIVSPEQEGTNPGITL